MDVLIVKKVGILLNNVHWNKKITDKIKGTEGDLMIEIKEDIKMHTGRIEGQEIIKEEAEVEAMMIVMTDIKRKEEDHVQDNILHLINTEEDKEIIKEEETDTDVLNLVLLVQGLHANHNLPQIPTKIKIIVTTTTIAEEVQNIIYI
jgi:hypothetical protein